MATSKSLLAGAILSVFAISFVLHTPKHFADWVQYIYGQMTWHQQPGMCNIANCQHFLATLSW